MPRQPPVVFPQEQRLLAQLGERLRPAAETSGWRLAPAFDINPNIDKAEHVLNIDDTDNRPSLHTVLNTAAFYGLSAQRARQVVNEARSAVNGWQAAARKAGIARADIELTAAAFSAHSEFP